MGAWAVGPFSNDDAADFVGDLAAMKARKVPARIKKALRLRPDGYLELPEACTAIAAAALVAMQGGYRPPSDTEVAADVEFKVDSELVGASLAALRRVRGPNSEWVEVWEESESLDEATGMLADLERHLPKV